MENKGLFDRGENGGNILAIEVIRATGIKASLLGYETRGRKSGNGPSMTYTVWQVTWHVLHCS